MGEGYEKFNKKAGIYPSMAQANLMYGKRYKNSIYGIIFHEM